MTTPTPALSIASHFLRTEKSIKAWLDKYHVKNYTLVPHEVYGFVVDVSGDVDLSDVSLCSIPVKFNHVKGFFCCSNNSLKSLKGCPEVVEKNFHCSFNNLTSLKHSSKKVGGSFLLIGNNVTSLKHSPEVLKGQFYSDNFTQEEFNDFYKARKEKELFESMQLTCTSSKKRSNKI